MKMLNVCVKTQPNWTEWDTTWHDLTFDTTWHLTRLEKPPAHLSVPVARPRLERPGRHGVEALHHVALGEHGRQLLGVRRPSEVHLHAVADVHQHLAGQRLPEARQRGVVLGKQRHEHQVRLAGRLHLGRYLGAERWRWVQKVRIAHILVFTFYTPIVEECLPEAPSAGTLRGPTATLSNESLDSGS